MLIPVSAASVERALNRPVPQPRLVNAAHEFEAQLMKEILKPMTASQDEDGGSAGALGEYGCEALARGLSDRGGFGIAQKLIAQLGASETGRTGVKGAK